MVTTRTAPSFVQITRLALVACSSEMPDSDAVRACMLANKAQLSAGCRATFAKAVASR